MTPTETTTHGCGGDVRIHAIDTGIKTSIVRHLTQRGAEVTLHPCTVSAEELSGVAALDVARGAGGLGCAVGGHGDVLPGDHDLSPACPPSR